MINGIIAEGPTIPVIRVVIHDEPLKGDSNQPCVADWVCSLCLNLFLTKLTPVRAEPFSLGYTKSSLLQEGKV